MPVKTPPCRLYFILAREAPVGVIFRRGPSKWVQLIKWRTDTDEFEAGQWFHGRIYETRADLSLSGELLIYPAAKQTLKQRDTEIGSAWTAVSKPPYLTALALWPNMSPGFGGGLFDMERSVRIWYPWDTLQPGPGFESAGHNLLYSTDYLPSDSPEPEQRQRLLRDGWTVLQEWTGVYDKKHYRYTSQISELLAKPHGSGGHKLLMSAWVEQHAQVVRFAVKDPGGAEHQIEGAAWADWDQAGRLVFVADGKLFAGEIGAGGIERQELANFNGNKFEAIKAPEWARSW